MDGWSVNNGEAFSSRNAQKKNFLSPQPGEIVCPRNHFRALRFHCDLT